MASELAPETVFVSFSPFNETPFLCIRTETDRESVAPRSEMFYLSNSPALPFSLGSIWLSHL